MGGWNWNIVDDELADLSFDMKDFGFTFEARLEDNVLEDSEEYDAFVDKFKEKKTSDECFTPPAVYDAVADWVAEEYGLDRENFVRPFYPGGDYQAYNYRKNCVVVDNPPFSIHRDIQRWYQEHGVKFFLFAPHLTSLTPVDGVCALIASADITYENGAVVNTDFITNLEDNWLRVVPTLNEAIVATGNTTKKDSDSTVTVHEWPDELVTSAACGTMAGHGQEFTVPRNKGHFVRKLDDQEEGTIFGGGLLVAQAQAQAQAQAKKTIKHELSEREKEIIRQLDEA